MAKLKAATRNKLPSDEFAGPDRSYPVPDASHAANAKARATQAVNTGRMSPAQASKIKAKANTVLGKEHSMATGKTSAHHAKAAHSAHAKAAHHHNKAAEHHEKAMRHLEALHDHRETHGRKAAEHHEEPAKRGRKAAEHHEEPAKRKPGRPRKHD